VSGDLATGASVGPRRLRPLVGFLIGLALLAAALVAVGSRWEVLSQEWASRGGGSLWIDGRWALALAVLLLPLGNWLCTSAAFWSLTRRYGRIGLWEMAALIATAGLLNYLPLRPGLVGRVAYHRLVNGIAVRQSVKVLIAILACSALAAVVLLGAAAAAGVGADVTVTVAAVAAPGVVLAGAWGIAWAREWSWAPYLAAASFRYLDMLAWTGRYAAAFALWGTPIGLGPAAVFAAVSQVVSLVPLAGNGLGLREWGTGYTAQWLVAAGVVAVADAAGARELGLAADLINRAGELIALVPVGILGWVWVTRQVARRARAAPLS
jgi:hypothetical protein